jgi:hypothetical protein
VYGMEDGMSGWLSDRVEELERQNEHLRNAVKQTNKAVHGLIVSAVCLWVVLAVCVLLAGA